MSCVKAKRDAPAIPRELYTSAYFEKMRAYAEREHDAWWILSAKHGLLDPDGPPVTPYDETPREYSATERREWAGGVYDDLEAAGLVDTSVHLVIHAGRAYYEPLLPLLESTQVGEVSTPTERLGPGETMAWYDGRAAGAESPG